MHGYRFLGGVLCLFSRSILEKKLAYLLRSYKPNMQGDLGFLVPLPKTVSGFCLTVVNHAGNLSISNGLIYLHKK